MGGTIQVFATGLAIVTALVTAQDLGAQSATRSSSEVVSPSVVATWTTVPGRPTIDLIVLWRGQPGWQRATPRRQSSGDGANQFVSSVEYGPVSLTVTFDRASRKALINTIEVDLRDDRIILVDDVDSRLKVVGTLPLAADLTGDFIASAIRQSAPAVQFLQCDLNSPAVANSPVFTRLCARVN